jgi:transposase
VRTRTAQVLAVENLFARSTGARPTSNAVKRFTQEEIDSAGLDPDVALAIKSNVAIIGALNEQIERLECRLRQCARLRSQFALLTTVPGIGETLATTIMLETGPIARFAKVGDYSSYCRCVDSARISNGKKKGEGNVKNGNKYLAWAFVEAANFAIRYCPEAKRFYERKHAKTNGIVALKAIAHKLARACYHMLREKRPFELMRCFA